MIQLVIRWLTFDAQNLIFEVWVAMAILWAALLILTITSIASLNISFTGKLGWFAFVVLAPILGLFIYCVRCIIRSESPAILSIPPRTKNKSNGPNPAWKNRDAETSPRL